MLFGEAQVDAEKTADALREFIAEIRDIRRARPVEGEELESCRDQLVLGFPLKFQTLGGVAGQVRRLVTADLPLDEWRTYVERVEQLDAGALALAARAHLHPDELLIVVAGDRARIEPGLRELGLGELTVLSQEDLQATL
jgi:zinc protease